jgi:hypothetical protein
MTEAEWLACEAPEEMLRPLTPWDGTSLWMLEGKLDISDRKLRLWAVACAQFAVTPNSNGITDEDWRYRANGEAVADGLPRPHDVVTWLADDTGSDAALQCFHFFQDGRMDRTIAARLLREIVGNPFRPVVIDSTWHAWDGGLIPALAGTIYQDRAWDRLPILADALEDAGCTDAALLEHLRGPGPHVRGCWALDAILGRE